MKTVFRNVSSIIAVVAMLTMPMVQTGCLNATAAQYASDAFYIAGSDFAVWQLGENPSAGKALDDLAALLPKIPLGQVKPYDLGVLSGELSALVSAKNATAASSAAETSAFDRIINLVGTASMVLNKGGNPTVITGAISAEAQSFANGMIYGKQFNAGRMSVVVPPDMIIAKGKLRVKASSSHP